MIQCDIQQDGECFWELLNDSSLRVVKFLANGNQVEQIFPHEELNGIFGFCEEQEQVVRANNVAKLRNGNERVGMGRFIYDNYCTRNETSKAQYASQILPIFNQVGLAAWQDVYLADVNRTVTGISWNNLENPMQVLVNYYNLNNDPGIQY